MTEPRKLVDWEAVEADYRCGQLTLRQIGDKHGTKAPTIIRRAKLGGWTKDRAVEIDQRTKAALQEAAAAEYVRNAVEQAEQRGISVERRSISAVEAATALNVRIIEGQRKDIQFARGIAQKLFEELGTDGETVHVRATTMQRLTSTMDMLTKLERQAYSIGQDHGAQTHSWEGFLDEAQEPQ